MRKWVLLASLGGAALFGTFVDAHGADPQIPVEKDIVYGTVDGVNLKLDLARPPSGAGPFSAVLVFHGGGWQIGNKAGHHGEIRQLAKRGYLAATVQYRFTPKY